jgi:ABC-type nitrate/sulfonate/bicarbonate transport system substrate-binding protein
MNKLAIITCLIILTFFSHNVFSVDAAATKITIVHATINPSVTPLWITAEQGFFAKYGIDPEIVFVKSTSIMMAGLASNRIPMAYGGGGGILGVEVSATGLKIVATFIGRVMNDLVAAPAIKHPQELRGKTIGVQSIGGTNWVIANLWLEHLGMDPRRDNIQIIPAGEQAVRVLAMEVGKIDASALGTAYSHSLKNKGFTILGDSMNIKVPLTGSDIVATKNLIEERPELLENILKALIEGVAFFVNPRNKSIVLKTMMRRLRLSDPVAAEEGWAHLARSIESKPYPSVKGLENLQKFMKTQDPRVAQLKAETINDPRFIRKLDESGFLDKVFKTSVSQ